MLLESYAVEIKSSTSLAAAKKEAPQGRGAIERGFWVLLGGPVMGEGNPHRWRLSILFLTAVSPFTVAKSPAGERELWDLMGQRGLPGSRAGTFTRPSQLLTRVKERSE
jgi:hypothetical protein